MAEPVAVTDQNFDSEVKEADKLVLVDFWAEWCGPCKRIAPAVQDLANEMADRLKVCKVDVDSSPETSSSYGIMSIPALLLFKNGEVIDQKMGYVSKEALKAWVEEQL